VLLKVILDALEFKVRFDDLIELFFIIELLIFEDKDFCKILFELVEVDLLAFFVLLIDEFVLITLVKLFLSPVVLLTGVFLSFINEILCVAFLLDTFTCLDSLL
jgi:hypothetical protein